MPSKRGRDHDALWQRLCHLYLAGDLPGVVSLKAATAKLDERNPHSEESEI